MSIVLIILTAVAGLIALLLIIGLFSKKGYAIEREINIDKPNHAVFNYIRFLKNQDYYNKWVMMDPGMQKQFKGDDGTDGFIYAWNGNNKAGAGEQEIKNITEGKKINMEVRFQRPFKGIAVSYMETESILNAGRAQDSTKVKWGFSSQLNYPMNLVLLFMNMDKILGKDIETSLTSLKSVLEK
jgi:hypothetical protein